MKNSPAQGRTGLTAGDPIPELRRGLAAGAVVLCALPALLVTAFGSAGIGFLTLVVTCSLAAFAWKNLIEPHARAVDDLILDASFRLDDAECRLAEAEQDLEQTQRRELEASRLALVARHTESTVVLTDREGRTEWVNDGFVQLTGFTLDEALGKSPGELLGSDRTCSTESNRMRLAVREGRAYSGEIWNRRKDGGDYLVSVEIEPLLDAEGQLTGFMGLEVDVTAEREVAESADRMRRLVEDTQVVVWEFDPDTERFLYVSPQAERYGYPLERWLEPEFFGVIVHPDDLEETISTCAAATARDEDHELRYRMCCEDGSIAWVRDLVRVARRDDSSVILRGVFVDITEQRAVEQDLETLSAHARVEAERLEMALSGGDIGLWDWKPGAGSLVVNERWAEMTGRQAGDLAHDMSDWLGALHPDDQEPTTRALQCHMANETEVFESTFRLRHKDGAWVWLFSRGKVVERDDDGKPTRMVGVQLDRTHEVERQLELEHLREKAEMASRSKSEFLANVSHEIRTPLTAILGYADILREDGDMERAPQRRIDMLDTIQTAGRHLLTLINDLLDLSKIEAERMTVEEIAFSLPGLLTEVLDLVRPRIARMDLELDAELATPIPSYIKSDPTRLRQVLVNILGNAAKFTDSGRVTLRATTTDEGTLRLEVEDTGAGMSAEEVGRLFRPFVQADGTVTRRFGGTGLGLTISRRLARLMGGDVNLVRTRPGHGTVFAVEIPLRTPEDVNYVESLENPNKGASPGAAKIQSLEGHILLVEDGVVNQRIFQTMLERAGAKVDLAAHGLEALALIDAAASDGRSYDLIVSDMQMPEMDGYSLARALRERGDETPIIALTAHAMAEDRDRCISAGCDDFVVKPVTRRGLVSACAYWLRGASSEAA